MASSKQFPVPSFLDAAEIEYGDPGSLGAPPEVNPKLVIASYNIRYAVGQFLISTGILRKVGFNFPRRRSETVGKNIRLAADAFLAGAHLPRVDILALQEADKGTARTGGHHIAQELAEYLEMAWAHAPAGLPRGIEPKDRQWWLNFEEQIGLQDSGDTGVATLSRFQMKNVTRIDLPWNECPWRPRLSIAATIEAGTQSIRVLNSHIDPHSNSSGQLDQVEIVLEHADRFSGPAVVLGDFNTLSRRKCIDTRTLLESRGYTTPFPTGTPTWRGSGIRLHADWIFVRGLEVTRWGVARPLNTSDHWPVWIEVSLPIAK